MDNKIYKLFLLKLFLIITISLIFISFLNYFFDPYGIYNFKWIIKGWNDIKPQINTHTRIHKTQKVFINNYDCIFLGTSRVEASMVFDPANIKFYNFCKSYYNASLGSSNIVEMYYMLNLVIKYSQPKIILYGLDFLQFNGLSINLNEIPINYFKRPLYTRITHLISYDMLKDIIRTIHRKKNEISFYDVNGGWNIEKNYLEKFPGIDLHTIFLITEKAFYYNFFDKFDYKLNKSSTWEYYKNISNIIYNKNDIKFFIYINPFHVRLIEVMDNRIGYQEFENWKKRLVELNNEIAKIYHKEPIPIYDFSGYNYITMENIDKYSLESRYFYDSSHIKKNVGEKIINSLLYNEWEKDFGKVLSVNNIEQYLQDQRNKQKKWRKENQSLIQEIFIFLK